MPAGAPAHLPGVGPLFCQKYDVRTATLNTGLTPYRKSPDTSQRRSMSLQPDLAYMVANNQISIADYFDSCLVAAGELTGEPHDRRHQSH